MKYKAIIDTDEFKDFEFFEDGIGKYVVGKDAGATQDGWIPLYFTEVKEESENENVLNKVRAEIDNLEEGISSYYNDRPWLFKDEVLKIVDKYIGESKGQ